MKLHLTKGLLVALMAAAAQTMAAEVTVGESTFASGSTITSEDDLIVSSGVGVSLGASHTVNSLTINDTFNLRYSVDYELTVADTISVNATFGLYDDMTAKMAVNSGAAVAVGGSYWNGGGYSTAYTTLTLKEGSTFTAGTISVAAGSTLNVSALLNAADLTVSSTGEDTYSDGNNGFIASGTAYSTSGLLGSGAATSLTLSSGSFVAVDDVTYQVADGGSTMNAVDTTTYYVNESASHSASMNGVLVQVQGGATLTLTSNIDSSFSLKGGTLLVNDDGYLGKNYGSTTTGVVTLVKNTDGTTSSNEIGSANDEKPSAIYAKVSGEGDLKLTSGLRVYNEMDFTGDLTFSNGSYDLGHNSWGYTPVIKNLGDVTIDSDATISTGVYGSQDNVKVINDGNLVVKGTFTADKTDIESSGGIEVVAGGKLTVNSTSSITLSKAISNSGTLVLNGATIYADALVSGEEGIMTTDGDSYTDGENGYSTAGKTTYTIVENADDAVLTTTATQVYLGETGYTLDANGTITVGEDGTIYFVNVDGALGDSFDQGLTTEIKVADGVVLDLSGVTTLSGIELDLGAGATVKLTNTIDLGSLTLADGVIFDVTEWEGFNALDEDIFKGVTAIEGATVVTLQMADGTIGAASLYLENGVVSIPEPTTATLSLLALAGLAARRRRK